LKTPRPESYPKEVDECKRANEIFGINEETFYLHNRSACESGWDFSSRWFGDGKSKESNRANEIIPIDLNCLIYFIENLLSSIYGEQNGETNIQLSQQFEQLSNQRKESIQTLFWSNQTHFFMDYDAINNCQTSSISLAGVYPLFFNLATKEQAEHVHRRLRDDFLQIGGLLTTLERTGQQWDSPNGWAPLQWIAYKGLKNYQFHQLANEIRHRWLTLNDTIYKQTGKMTEKYNVIDQTHGGGGNYPLQDGFGWTNGVYLKLLQG
jgi:alpha,alpha-trehalase